MRWIPILGLVLLAAVLLDKALRRDARRTWSWGRGGGTVPLSRAAYGVWGITVLCTAWVLAQAPHPGPLAALALAGCLIAIAVVGISDHRAQRRARRPGP